MADPHAAEVRTQLQRILASQEFQSSDRLCRFLRFTVEARLRGEQDQVKEYSIGREVFDRNGNYDPRTDPIVRVEARRLRKKLEEYYSGPGAADPIRIAFPKGSYVPVFEMPSAPGAAMPSTRTRIWLAALALGAAAMAALVFVGRSGPSSPTTDALAVIPARWVWHNEDFSNTLHDEDLAERIAAELAARPNANVIAWPSLQKFRSANTGAKQIAEALHVARILIVTVRVEASGHRATAFLVDAGTERKLGVSDRSSLDLSSPAARHQAAAEIAAAIAALPAYPQRR